jgi:hypothetical protein
MRNPTPVRLVKRAGIWLMMWAVFAGMALGWVHDGLTAFFAPILAKLHLDKIAPWLKERSLWWLAPVGTILIVLSAGAKYIEIWLFVHHWPVGIVAFVLFKGAAVGIGNMFVIAYAERLLRVRWIAKLYRSYCGIRDELMLFVRQRAWYRYAVHLRDSYRAWRLRTITIMDFAKRAAGMHRCCLPIKA